MVFLVGYEVSVIIIAKCSLATTIWPLTQSKEDIYSDVPVTNKGRNRMFLSSSDLYYSSVYVHIFLWNRFISLLRESMTSPHCYDKIIKMLWKSTNHYNNSVHDLRIAITNHTEFSNLWTIVYPPPPSGPGIASFPREEHLERGTVRWRHRGYVVVEDGERQTEARRKKRRHNWRGRARIDFSFRAIMRAAILF